MATIIPPGFAQVLHPLQLSGASRSMLVTYGISVEDAPTVVTVNAIHNAFEGEWDDFMSSAVSFLPTIVRVGQDGGDPVTITSTVAVSQGASGSTYFPPNTAMLIKKQTAAGGRRNRGRMFMPFVVPESGADNSGQIDPAFLSGRQAAATAWLGSLTTITNVGNMVILHSEGPSTPTTVTGLSVDPLLATQRKRMRR